MSGYNNTLTQATKITLTFLMSLLAIAIMLGNAVVILAFVVDRNLRHRSNYFFLNLAIADFLVGAVSIPLYMPSSLTAWTSGREACVFWLITDYLVCTASVYNVVLISYDRYQSVSDAVSYRVQNTGTWRIVAWMAAVWVLSFLTNGPMILISESWKGNATNECVPGFFNTRYIAVFTSLFEFLVPIFLVAYFNAFIYWSLWKRGNLSRCLSHSGLPSASSSNDHGYSCRPDPGLRVTLPAQKEAASSLSPDKLPRKSSLLFPIRAHKNRSMVASNMSSLFQSESQALQQREHFELLRARKLAKSLAVLLGAFIICWAPYSLTTIIYSIFPKKKFTQSNWYKIAFWLQWFNSFVNPFLYPLCHRRFQKAFLKILPLRKQPMPSHNRSVST
ncbi:histamine H4 receptor [Octodon degus]|uniref:Histamine H4 receptor n=1 Tax=Octodon degus TaxID=10160 RepID=A0A6P3FE41_OCTDE|nr:histamine H4 receptor [Octodon degus]